MFDAVQRGAVDLGEVGADLSGRQALGRQRQHDRVDVAQASLAFGDDHRVEGALTISGTVISIGPTLSVSTVLVRTPLREFPLLRPATSCLS